MDARWNAVRDANGRDRIRFEVGGVQDPQRGAAAAIGINDEPQKAITRPRRAKRGTNELASDPPRRTRGFYV
jgi:hypothetical protein